MHSVEVVRRAVSGGVRVVPVRPHGGHGGVAALRHDAPQRPRVRQVAPQHHVLNQDVHRFLRALLASGGGSVRSGGGGGVGVHAGSRRDPAEGDPGDRREEGGVRECAGYR